MNADYVPLLQIQRDLYRLPRNQERFQRYLRTLSSDGNVVELPPLVFMNPMAKEHVAVLLDSMLALNADAIASRAVNEARAQTTDVAGDFKIGLVIADDLMGGWTNRYDGEFNIRFGPAPVNPTTPRPKWLKHYWLTAVCWSSEPITEQSVREAIQTAIHRQAYVQRHGPARTLRERLSQEGHVMTAAGCSGPFFDDEEIAYTREVLAPFLDAEDKRTTIECLFGDTAGRTLGFTPRGLSLWAGLRLALHDARAASMLLASMRPPPYDEVLPPCRPADHERLA